MKKIKILEACIKLGTNLFDFTGEKGWNVRQVMGKVKKKVNLGVVEMNL
jgi:aminopeptidase-like protein